MEEPLLVSDQYVQTVLHNWPQSKAVFFALNTACVGCQLARFCTLTDVALTYQLSPELLLAKIQAVINDDTKIQSGGIHDKYSI